MYKCEKCLQYDPVLVNSYLTPPYYKYNALVGDYKCINNTYQDVKSIRFELSSKIDENDFCGYPFMARLQFYLISANNNTTLKVNNETIKPESVESVDVQATKIEFAYPEKFEGYVLLNVWGEGNFTKNESSALKVREKDGKTLVSPLHAIKRFARNARKKMKSFIDNAQKRCLFPFWPFC